jgi:hypothetical protein
VDPFQEGLVDVFAQIRQFLSLLLDPLESDGIDSARPVLAAHAPITPICGARQHLIQKVRADHIGGSRGMEV